MHITSLVLLTKLLKQVLIYSSGQKKVPVPFACNDRSTVWASPFRTTQSVRTTVADSAIIAAWGKRLNLATFIYG